MELSFDQSDMLLSVAKKIAFELKLQKGRSKLRIRMPNSPQRSNTDGWYARIGDLGKNQPVIEVWLDRFIPTHNRELSIWFVSDDMSLIHELTAKIAKRLWPVRNISSDEIDGDAHLALSSTLTTSELKVPILVEHFQRGFYGFFGQTDLGNRQSTSDFTNLAVSFVSDVAHEHSQGEGIDEQWDAYSRFENRKAVASHLRRERSRLLATECKIRDKYQCQVCMLRFEKVYGELGYDFAESHHLVPLSKLKENIKTNLSDLITVCANCHRMLHRMDGERGDVESLKSVIRKTATQQSTP